MNAFQTIQWNNHLQTFTEKMMQDLVNKCTEPEVIELKRMHGAAKVFETIEKIYIQRYQYCKYHVSSDIHNVVLERLHKYSGTKQRLSQLLDEEHQRELEHELEEERQVAEATPVQPCSPKLHEGIKQLCNPNNKTMDFRRLSNVFWRLHCAFMNTTFFNDCQPDN